MLWLFELTFPVLAELLNSLHASLFHAPRVLHLLRPLVSFGIVFDSSPVSPLTFDCAVCGCLIGSTCG